MITDASTYPLVTLGEVLTHRKEFIEIDDLTAYKRCRVQLHAQGIVLRDTVVGAEVKTKRQQVCRSGEFLVAEIDAKLGGFGIIPPILEGAIVSSHYFLFEINEAKLDRQFLAYYIRTSEFRDQVAAQGSTNYAAIRPKDVLTYTIPLPPLAEQRRIVARIEEIAAKIAEARRLREEAVEESNAFISSLHNSLAKKRIVRLDQLLVLYEEREDVLPGHEYPQVGVKGFGQGLFAKAPVDASQTSYRSFNRLYEGAIVLSQVKGWEGAVAVCLDSNLVGKYVSPEYRTFRCVEEEVDVEYMASLVTSTWFWIQLTHLSKGLGGRRERTRPEQFLQMTIPMPSLQQQKQAVGILKKLTQIYPLQAETAAELDALLPSVLDRAFRRAI